MSLVRTHTGTIEGRPCDYHTRTYPCSPGFTPSYQYTRPGESPNDGQWLESEETAGSDWLKRIAAEQSANQKPAPDPEGWKAKYYPVPAEGFTGTALEAARASRLKWSGYLPDALAWFELGKPPVTASFNACHCCSITGNHGHASITDCGTCPIVQATGDVCIDACRQWTMDHDPEPMIALLDKAIAHLEAEKKAEPEGLRAEVGPDQHHVRVYRGNKWIATVWADSGETTLDEARANAELFVNAAKTKREHARMLAVIRRDVAYWNVEYCGDSREPEAIEAEERAILEEIGGEK